MNRAPPCDRHPAVPIAAIASVPQRRRDASRHAGPFRRPPDRVCRFCAAHQRQAAEARSFLVRLPAGSSPPFFFLRRQRVFHRPGAADLFVDLKQFAAQFPEPLKGLDLALRLAQIGGGSEGFSNRFPLHFAREPEVGAVGRLVGLMTTALWFTTTTADGSD